MSPAALAGFIMGLAGSFHCIGMCGPIAMALPVHRYGTVMKLLLILSYNAGRILTYSLMGVVAGVAGAAFVLSGYQRAATIVCGVIMIVAAVFVATGSRLPVRANFLQPIKARLSSLFRASGKSGLFFIGMLNGLLPCGLVYMALAAAVAGGGIPEGGFTMTMFGLGTLPVMLAASYAGSFITPVVRNRMRRAVPVFVAALGVLLVLRGLNLGIPYVSPRVSGEPAPSCHQVTGRDHLIICTGQN